MRCVSQIDSSKATTNQWGERWTKLVQNGMGNGVTAATGMTSGDCLRNDIVRRLQIKLAGEAVRVGQALGYQLEKIRGFEADVFARAAEGDAAALAQIEPTLIPQEGANPRGAIQRPSMAQDMIKGRRTEIDAMNGYIAAKGAEIGVPAPNHAMLTEIVTRVERAGMTALWADASRPDVSLSVVRTFAPGMRHFWNRYAPGRLYDVPPRLGWRDGGYTEADLNPWAMIL